VLSSPNQQESEYGNGEDEHEGAEREAQAPQEAIELDLVRQ
jgi:hypothetical protein